MKSSDYLYLDIINSIEIICDRATLDEIENNVTPAEIERAYDVTELLQSENGKLQDHYSEDLVYNDLGIIYSNVLQAKEILSKQVKVCIDDTLFKLNLALKFCELTDEIPDKDDIFFSKMVNKYDLNSYIDCDVYENPDYGNNSGLVFINNLSELNLEHPVILEESNHSAMFYLLILRAIHGKKISDISNFLIIETENSGVSDVRSLSILKTHLICSGRSFHRVSNIERNNLNCFIEKINTGEIYNQFNDSLMILSEYNSRRELLNKYLSMYHLVENFMCRYPLVKLSRENDGNIFSMRDFRSIHDNLDRKETILLKNFYLKVFSNQFKSGHYLHYSHDAFKNLVINGAMSESEVDHALRALGIKNKNGPYTYNEISSYSAGKIRTDWVEHLVNITYGIRCAIVHNKETEFHLSHDYLSEEISSFINEFLLSVLENTMVGLLIEKNNIIWYQHSSISLYQD
ncbi:hypothetical protein AB6C52_13120 [Vibrio cyclitrophicus]